MNGYMAFFTLKSSIYLFEKGKVVGPKEPW